MQIHDFDGYDDYPTAQLLREHVRIVGAAVSIVSGGRNGGNRLRCNAAANYVCRAFKTSPAEVVIGAYLEIAAFPVPFLEFRDATNGQVYLIVESDGSIGVYRPSIPENDFNYPLPYNDGYRTLLGRTAAGVISAALPFHIQARLLVSDTVGELEIRVNGVPRLTLTNQDTRTGTATITNILIGNGNVPGGGVAVYVDDLWSASTFVGDRRVDSHYPIADGANQDGVASSGPADPHYPMVDEPSPDDDTSYVTLDAAGERESYGCEDFKNPGASIDAVMIVVDAKKTDAGAATLATHIRQDATNDDGTTQGITTDYARYKQVYETDPVRTGAWDEAGFEAAEFGLKKVA
jgi:hypothetical protein